MDTSTEPIYEESVSDVSEAQDQQNLSSKENAETSIHEKLFIKRTISDVSLKYGSSGESRREMVERLKHEKEQEEEAALSFKPHLMAKAPKKTPHNGSVRKRDAYVDKELTFSPQITEKGMHLERPKNSKDKADLLFSSPGAGRPRDSLDGIRASNSPCDSDSFTPEITRVAKRLPSNEKLKGGPRLYAKSKSRELEKQMFSPSKTKEEMECTFRPKFESKSSFTKSGGKAHVSPKKTSKTTEELECTFQPTLASKAVFISKSSAKQAGQSQDFIDETNTSAPDIGSDKTTASTTDSCDTPSLSSGRRVLVVGSSNVDLISYVKEHPQMGATITGLSFEKNYGGKGANQAVMAARLCRPVSATSPRPSTSTCFLTKVGCDIYGKDYLSYLEAEEGFSSNEGLLRAKDPAITTGLALITVDQQGQNTIVLQPGANLDLQPQEVTTFISKQAPHSNVLVCQNEISHSATLQALAEVSEIDHMVTIFNPAPISNNIDSMFELLRYSDVICPNEVELALLADMPVTNEEEAVKAGRVVLEKCRNLRKLVHFMTRERSNSGGDSEGEQVHIPEESAGAAARRPQVIVVTLGSLGACIVSDSGNEMIAAPRVKAIDTVGAGDCFIGTLSYHISNGVNLKQSVIYAVECASITVTRKGAQSSYPERKEMNYSYKVNSIADSNLNLN